MSLKISIITAITLLFCGCRAFTGDNSSGGSPSPQAQQGNTSDVSSSESAPNDVQHIDLKSDFKKELLLEGLGRSILAQFKPELLGLISTKKSTDPLTAMDSGMLIYKQVLAGPENSELRIESSGPYQRIKLASGSETTIFGPIVVTIDSSNYPGLSLCETPYQLTGHIRCTLKGNYDHSVQKMNVTGQCLTHNGGAVDNLRFKIAGDEHRIRYALGLKIEGKGEDLTSHQWIGSAYVDGISTSPTPSTNSDELCKK